MSRLALALAVGALVVVPSAGYAASAKPAAAPAQTINNFWIDIYGGQRLANTLDWKGVAYDLAPGPSFGATIGMNFGQGFAADLDVMQVNSYYTGYGASDDLDTTSFMADVDYTAWLSDDFGVYGGIGAGLIWLTYDQGSASGVGGGVQAKAGIIAKVSDTISLFSEAKMQEALGGAITVNSSGGTYQIGDANTSILAGLRFNMN